MHKPNVKLPKSLADSTELAGPDSAAERVIASERPSNHPPATEPDKPDAVPAGEIEAVIHGKPAIIEALGQMVGEFDVYEAGPGIAPDIPTLIRELGLLAAGEASPSRFAAMALYHLVEDVKRQQAAAGTG